MIHVLSKYKLQLFYCSAIAAGILAFIFLVTTTWIGSSVKERCLDAKRMYGENLTCTQALSKRLDDETASYEQRNNATWALGQIGDRQALSTLYAHYSGDVPNKESYTKSLSQYELFKAINLIESGTNITAFVWRHNLP